MGTFKLSDNVILFGVHDESECEHRPCVVHSPTDHHMLDFPLHWRSDRGIFERICSHGFGHPDPDQFDYWSETGQKWQGIHGCDGCCAPQPCVTCLKPSVEEFCSPECVQEWHDTGSYDL